MNPSSTTNKGLPLWHQLRRHGWKHWCWVLLLTAVGTIAAQYFGKNDSLVTVRYKLYNATMALSRLRGALYPQRTAVVLIGDDEYWSEPLAGRTPIKRDYLAALIGTIEQFRPASIAVDFDLRSPRPAEPPRDFPDYGEETKVFASQVSSVASRTPIILPVSVGFDKDGDYIRQPAVFDNTVPCTGGVHCGYIQLPYDLRRVPLSIDLADGYALDSFSGAVIRSLDEEAYRRAEQEGMDALPFAGYLSEAEFSDSNHVISAGDVLHGSPEKLRTALAHRAVFIGANWSANAYHTGNRVDIHAAPTGAMPGALLHANYVEAILGSRTYRPVPEVVVEGFEIALVLGLAVLWALDASILTKWAATLGALAGSFLLTYVLIQNLGVFLDFAVPFMVVAAHLGIDKILEWRGHRLEHAVAA